MLVAAAGIVVSCDKEHPHPDYASSLRAPAAAFLPSSRQFDNKSVEPRHRLSVRNGRLGGWLRIRRARPGGSPIYQPQEIAPEILTETRQGLVIEVSRGFSVTEIQTAENSPDLINDVREMQVIDSGFLIVFSRVKNALLVDMDERLIPDGFQFHRELPELLEVNSISRSRKTALMQIPEGRCRPPDI